MMERLQKVMAHAGVASRRKCEEMIRAGRVTVDGRVVTEMGTKVDPRRAAITVDGQPIAREEKVYILLHKPQGFLSDVADVRGWPSALNLVPHGARLYPAGRLDVRSEGLLLLTNDGQLAHRLTHPRFEHEKEYLVLVEGRPSRATLRQLLRGVEYDGDLLRADSVERVERLGREALVHGWESRSKGLTWLRVVLHEGKKRHIRHMCSTVGHPVWRLIRVRIGPLKLGTLKSGKWRYLTEREVKVLMRHTASPRKR